MFQLNLSSTFYTKYKLIFSFSLLFYQSNSIQYFDSNFKIKVVNCFLQHKKDEKYASKRHKLHFKQSFKYTVIMILVKVKKMLF